MDVQATDNGIPPRSANTIARITINIFRNENDPFFVPPNYVTTIPETTEIGSNVLTVSARDTDDLVSDYTFPGVLKFDCKPGCAALPASGFL